MIISNLERIVRYLPFLKRYYLNNYSTIRLNVFRARKLYPMINFPRYVHLLVTFNCNLNCKQCQVDANRKKVDALSTFEMSRIIREMQEAGVRHLIITGGEPLTRPDIFDILRSAGESSIPRITLATNGYLVRKYKSELSDVRIDRVVTSIDDLEEKNDLLRGKQGAFERALEALDIFKEIGVKDRIINTTVMPGNIAQLEELADVIEGSSATGWVWGLLVPTGRGDSLDSKHFDDNEYRKIFDRIKKLRQRMPVELNSHTGYLKDHFQDITSEPFYCRAGREVCSINPDGEVLPCSITADTKYSQGNLREQSFKTIWEEGFKELRDPQYPHNCNECKFLNACGGGCWGYRVLQEKYCYKNFCT